MQHSRLVATFLLTLASASGHADIYGYVDEQGISHFSAEKSDARYQLLVLPVVALAALVGLRWFLQRTALGRQVTAVTHHREVATAMGVDTNRVTWLTIALGGMLGALGGALASPTTSFTPGIGADMMVLSFAVVATAGLGQIGGAALAALLIGLTRSFAVYLMPEVEVLVPYLIMVAVLLVRPEGLFSTVAARRI